MLHRDIPDRLRRDQALPGALVARKGCLYEVLPPEGDTAWLRLRDEITGAVTLLAPPAIDYYRLVRAAPTCPDTPDGALDA